MPQTKCNLPQTSNSRNPHCRTISLTRNRIWRIATTWLRTKRAAWVPIRNLHNNRYSMFQRISSRNRSRCSPTICKPSLRRTRKWTTPSIQKTLLPSLTRWFWDSEPRPCKSSLKRRVAWTNRKSKPLTLRSEDAIHSLAQNKTRLSSLKNSWPKRRRNVKNTAWDAKSWLSGQEKDKRLLGWRLFRWNASERSRTTGISNCIPNSCWCIGPRKIASRTWEIFSKLGTRISRLWKCKEIKKSLIELLRKSSRVLAHNTKKKSKI